MNTLSCMAKSLTHQELIFSDGILNGLMPPEAARQANYAETTAVGKASSWVEESRCPANKRHVLEYINEKRAKITVKAEVDAVDLLRQLQEMRISDYADIVDTETQMFKKVTDWPLVWRQMITGVEVMEVFEGKGDDRAHIGNLHKIKFMDKTKVMKMFGEHVNIKGFQKIEQHQHLHLHESPERLGSGRDRALNFERDCIDLGRVIDVEASDSTGKPDIKRLTQARRRAQPKVNRSNSNGQVQRQA